MRISYNKEENAFIIDADNTVIINDGNQIGLELCDLTNPHGVSLQWSKGSILSSKESYMSDEFRKMPLGKISRALFIRIFYKRKPSFKIPEKETIGLYIHPPVIPNTANQKQTNMSKKKTRHSAKDGKFVSKEFAASNPDEVVEVTNHDHKTELEKFRSWIIENGKDINSETVVSEYLTNPEYLRD